MYVFRHIACDKRRVGVTRNLNVYGTAKIDRATYLVRTVFVGRDSEIVVFNRQTEDRTRIYRVIVIIKATVYKFISLNNNIFVKQIFRIDGILVIIRRA